MYSKYSKYWYEKHRPRTLQDYVFQDENHKTKVLEILEQKHLPHMLLCGVTGTGKTTLALLLVDLLEVDDSDVLIINASDENSIDDVRNKIKPFVTSAPYGDFKVVILEECDYISQNGQGALRRIMEEYKDNASFILTCNYDYKLLPEIKGRCTYQFKFKAPDKNDIAENLITILSSENVSFNLDVVDKYIEQSYPDVRSMINRLQQRSVNGVLQPPITANDSLDYKEDLMKFIQSGNWVSARKLVCEQVAKEEYVDIYRFLYDNLHLIPKFKNQDKWDDGILAIGEYLDKQSRTADAEITMANLFITLGKI